MPDAKKLNFPTISSMFSMEAVLFYAMYVMVSSPEAHGRITRMIGDNGVVNHVLHAMVFLFLLLFITGNFFDARGLQIFGKRQVRDFQPA